MLNIFALLYFKYIKTSYSFRPVIHRSLLWRNFCEKGGYNGSFCATHSGFSVPVIPVQTVPYY